MRATRWLLGCLAVLLVAALAAAWLLPPRLDGDRFRAPLQRFASRVLGAPVRIEGPIRLRLLPQPVLVAGPFHIAPAAPADARLSAEGLRLELALGPLLAGRIEARSLVLQHPDLRLPEPLDPRILLARRPAWLGGASARIEDGRIEAGAVALTGVDATLGVDPLSGDLAASGIATLSGGIWRFAVRLTRPGGDGAAGIDVSLNGQGGLGGTTLTLSGQLAADGGLQGHVAARGPDLSLLLPVPALPFAAEGRISVASGLAAADDLSVELGGSPARGAVALRFAPSPRLDLALTASRLDLDPWAATLARSVQSGALPGGLPLGIDLSAEAATLARGTLRGLRAAFDIEPGGLHVRELRATLPGEAALRLSGTVAAGSAPHLDADATLAAPALRTTLDWLAPLLPQPHALPAGVLRQADLSAHVVAGPEGMTLSRLAGTLDGGRISGAIGWRRGTAVKLAGIVSLQHLDLDPWLAPGPGIADLDLRLDARTALLHGVALAPFHLDLAREDGAIEVRSVQASAGGVAASAHFSLSASGRLENATLVLDAPRLASLAALPIPGVTWDWPSEAPMLQDKLHVVVDASGTRQSLSLRARAALGDLRIEAQPTLDLADGHWNGTVSLRHPSARRLLEATRLLPGRADWLGEGSLSLRADCTGEPGTVAFNQFDVTAGGLRGTGTLRLSWQGSPSLSGEVDADTLPLPPIARAGVDAVLLGGAPSWRARLHVNARHVLVNGAEMLAPFAGDLAVADGTARLDAVRAGLAGGALQGQAALDWSAEPPRLDAQMSLSDAAIDGALVGLPVDIASGRIGMRARLTARGHSTAAMLSTVQGTMGGSVAAGIVQGVALDGLSADLPRAAVEAALAGGSTKFDNAEFGATLDHGVATVTQGQLAGAGRIDHGQRQLRSGAEGRRPAAGFSAEHDRRLRRPAGDRAAAGRAARSRAAHSATGRPGRMARDARPAMNRAIRSGGAVPRTWPAPDVPNARR